MDMLVFMGWSSVHTQLPFQIIIPTASGVFSNKFFPSRHCHIKPILKYDYVFTISHIWSVYCFLWIGWKDISKDTSNCLQKRVILTKPFLLLLHIKKALQCVAISHWSRGFLTNEEYWDIPSTGSRCILFSWLMRDKGTSLSFIGREKSRRVLS